MKKKTKRKAPRLKGSYKKKYETIIRRKGVREKVSTIKSLYKLKTLTPKEIKKLNKTERKEYYKLQYRIATGKFEATKRKIFRENYIKYLDSIQASDETIRKAKRLLRRRDLETIAHELDTISEAKEVTITGRTLKDDMTKLLPVRFYDISRQEGGLETLEENIDSLYEMYYPSKTDEDEDDD